MNANELMIDDWVFIRMNHTTKDYKQGDFIPHRVTGDLYPNKRNERWTIALMTIESNENYEDFATPIPLTPEILEKNGFIEDRYIRTGNKFYRHEQSGFRLKVGIDSDGNFYVFDNITIQCNYVHQLQHAMRICGIENEFVL